MPDHITFAVREDAEPAVPCAVPPHPELAVLVPTRDEAANIPLAGRAATAAS